MDYVATGNVSVGILAVVNVCPSLSQSLFVHVGTNDNSTSLSFQLKVQPPTQKLLVTTGALCTSTVWYN